MFFGALLFKAKWLNVECNAIQVAHFVILFVRTIIVAQGPSFEP